MKTLILKNGFGSFENYYIKQFNLIGEDSESYYNSTSVIMRIWLHLGLPFESIWYGDWKNNLDKYDKIIVFDAILSPKIIDFIKKKSKARIIFWHWNIDVNKKADRIYKKSKNICEHWTFDPEEALNRKYKLNNQFFFYQNIKDKIKMNKAYFVGTDKGRYKQILEISSFIEKKGITADFHVVDKNKEGKFYQKDFVAYDNVLKEIKESKYVVEIVQEGQKGLTSRSLEAMFSNTKLITNNDYIQKCSFYNSNNIYLLKSNKDFNSFIKTDFEPISKNKLEPYSAEGWLKNFDEE